MYMPAWGMVHPVDWMQRGHMETAAVVRATRWHPSWTQLDAFSWWRYEGLTELYSSTVLVISGSMNTRPQIRIGRHQSRSGAPVPATALGVPEGGSIAWCVNEAIVLMPKRAMFNGLYFFAQKNSRTGFIWTCQCTVQYGITCKNNTALKQMLY
jgi:hypothetical protein